uniref:Uncharacterized protein n=1 Tax=Noctiluca scintillans TaxID=2966 RepID=A0A7S1F258_NOCSC|mmetsp:Transcript_26132/g.68743  ORF Transcript_26132/g.68743 Transcript_26132/m.68743 type:complete len:128 (+) Transcript_26132:87-470(+)
MASRVSGPTAWQICSLHQNAIRLSIRHVCRARSHFSVPRGKPTWRCAKLLGDRIYFQRWSYLNRDVKKTQSTSATESAAPQAQRGAPVRSGRPTRGDVCRLHLASSTGDTEPAPDGLPEAELRALCS